MKPKIKNVPFGRLMITASQIKTASGLILDAKADSKKPTISDVQTVVSVGLNCLPEAGIDIKEGDKILLNIANPRLGHPVFFHKETGEIAKATDSEQDCEMFLIIEAREVIMVL